MNQQSFRANEPRGNYSDARRGNDRDALQRHYSNPNMQHYQHPSNIDDQQHQSSLMRFDDSALRFNSLMPMDFGLGALHSRHNRLFDSALSAFEAPFSLHHNLNSSMQQMSSFGGGSSGGFYSSQVMVMNSTVGPDGKPHVEKYAKASSGNLGRKIAETKEAYSNSSTGIDKLAWERQLDSRGRRVVQERNRATGDVVSNDELAGMTRDDECETFNSEWEDVATQHLPYRPRIPLSVMAEPQQQQYSNYSGQLAGGAATGAVRQIEAADVSEEQQGYQAHSHQQQDNSRRHRRHHQQHS